MEMDFEVSGFDELIREINRLPGLLAERVQGDGLIAAARVARDEAKQNVPVGTGALRDTIRATRRAQTVETAAGRKKVPGAAAQVRAGGPDARQAMLVEYGHGGPQPAPPHPYLEPAITGTTARQFSAAAAAMRRSFVKLGRDLAAGKSSKLTRRLIAEDT